MDIIRVDGLTKTYRNGKGIFDLDFSVKEGEVFGYLGPNGAGKTTTIRQLMGFTNADKGNCTILGLDCRSAAEEIQRHVGYLPGEIAFFESMTGLEFLEFINAMRKTKNTTMMSHLIERFELDPTRKIRKMSKGMKQKVGIIAAFMHDPKVYILDEPTSGLDPLMQRNFIQLINEEKSRGKTVIMSSHIFEEIERTSDRVGVIRDGRLVTVEDIHSIKSSLRRVFVVTLETVEDIEHIKKSNLEIGAINGRQVEIAINSNYQDFISTLSSCSVVGIDILDQSLEQVFMKYYGEGGNRNE